MPKPDLLNCPDCGEPCEALPPDGYNIRSGAWWSEGRGGTCQCGSAVTVKVDEADDGNVAYLSSDDE